MEPCEDWGYTNTTAFGLGCDRTSAAAGSSYTTQYAPVVAKLFNDPDMCPEELLLFFHHLPWTHRLRSSGKTIIQHCYDSHAEGLATVAAQARLWGTLKGIDATIQAGVAARFRQQQADATAFSHVLVSYWHNISGIPTMH